MKTGLIMEGGAMRGMFTAGVIDVLMGLVCALTGQSVSLQEPSLAAIINPVRLGG